MIGRELPVFAGMVGALMGEMTPHYQSPQANPLPNNPLSGLRPILTRLTLLG